MFFIAAGLLTILNNEVPGSEYLDKPFLYGLGVVCVALGLIVTVLPWTRWPRWVTLTMPTAAFAFIAFGNHVGGVSAYSFATFFVLVFVWIGLAHPPGTSLLMAPLAAAAYVIPAWLTDLAVPGAVSSVTVAIPVCILVGETIARVVRKLSERERALQRSHELLDRSQELAGIGSWEVDAGAGPSAPLRWSREMYRLFAVDPDRFEPSWRSVEPLVHPDDRELVRRRVLELAASGKGFDGVDVRVVRPDGSVRWLWFQASTDAQRRGTVVGFAQDVTERKVVEEELQRLALVDELTGLRNRRGFMVVAEAAVGVASRAERDLTLLFLDLDDMKAINDHHGHQAGDAALVETAQLLRSTFRESDVIARVGGDEFCVLLTAEADGAESYLDRLDAELRRRPPEAFPPLSLSTGRATCRWNQLCSVEDLIERADAAMYEAKRRKRAASPRAPVPGAPVPRAS